MKKSLVPALGVCALCFGTLASAFAAPKMDAKATAKPTAKVATKPVAKKKTVAKKATAKKTTAKKVVAKKTVKATATPKMAPKAK